MSAALQQKPEIKIKLTVSKGPHAGQVYQMNKSDITIGRGPENDIVLMNDPQVSRNHAKISVVDNDLEVVNLSKKNAVFVQGQEVQKWKIVNNSGFTVGDSEFLVEYDLGQLVVSVPQRKPAPVVPLKGKAPASAPSVPPAKQPSAKNLLQPLKPNPGVPANRAGAPMPRPGQAPMRPRPMPPGMRRPPQGQMPINPNGPPPGFVNGAPPPLAAAGGGSILANPKFKMYLIAAVVLGGLYMYFDKPDKVEQNKKIASTLTYEDEVNIKLNSKTQTDLERAREDKAKEIKNSPQKTRVDENFVRAMRDFQLGNYARAQEFFQLVLNLDPDHQLAKRYLYLCKVRFDEILQEKLMLGESYFKKHNFRMCESLYRQVMDMLVGKANSQQYLLAEKKARECELADQGIR